MQAGHLGNSIERSFINGSNLNLQNLDACYLHQVTEVVIPDVRNHALPALEVQSGLRM